MGEKIKLIDLSKCIGCRACQTACKQWNQLKPVKTINRGTHQNPPDLSPETYTLIRYDEVSDGNGGLKWLMRKDGCMHCTDAACLISCPAPGALTYREHGAVVLNRSLCIGCKNCVIACPFSIPRFDEKAEKPYKCTLCYDRITDGQIPACIKSCPTGTLTWGDKNTMIKKAYARAEKVGKGSIVYGDKFVKGTHVMYVLTEKPETYAALPASPKVPLSVRAWKDILKPLITIGIIGSIAAALFHYFTFGPKTVEKFEKKGGE
ncbi:MAG TPA: 4Fe-4S dicluster domain-containing protein [Nitrospinota bacterium]|nr:4Fe-4S dicluster domain-containing protein [Nitrospinota bacterium]